MRDPDPTCLFCRILAGELPAQIVDEDERTVSFMDINPATRGHALVIPRAHSVDLHDTPPEDVAATAGGALPLARRGRARPGRPRAAPPGPGPRPARRRRREPPERVRDGRLAVGLPFPRACDPALRG